ncbi:MAG: serine kinase [Pseudomonadota bacterium]
MVHTDESIVIHACCVALEARGLLILGAAGAGKSGLALDLISRGAQLVADDRVDVRRVGEHRLSARPPKTIAGKIEVRGLGILDLPHQSEAEIVAAYDIDRQNEARLPEPQSIELLGVSLPLYSPFAGVHPTAALHLALLHGFPHD